MRAKYLGEYYHEVNLESEYNSDEYMQFIWVNSEDSEDVINDEFMRISDEELFHGVMSETNTSALAIKLSNCGESAKIWRIW